jgi:hypothetical protein
MDIDKMKSDVRCFNCEKPGHFHYDCPKPKKKFNIWAQLITQYDEEELAEAGLLKPAEVSWSYYPKEDFLDGR